MRKKRTLILFSIIMLGIITIFTSSCTKDNDDNGSLVVLSTSAITNITDSEVLCGGNISSNGGEIITERGVCWSVSENPTISNSKNNNGKGMGAFICTINGLSKSTVYYVRAYAITKNGVAYGNQEVVETIAKEPNSIKAKIEGVQFEAQEFSVEKFGDYIYIIGENGTESIVVFFKTDFTKGRHVLENKGDYQIRYTSEQYGECYSSYGSLYISSYNIITGKIKAIFTTTVDGNYGYKEITYGSFTVYIE